MKLSVIIPTYNRPEKLRRSIESIISQSIDNIEIIVVDGSNVPHTKTIIHDLNEKRIKHVIINNKSAANSRNVGLGISTGDYIAFNDDDDEWFAEKAEKQIRLFQTYPNINIVYSSFSKIKNGEKMIIPDKTIIKKKGFLYQELLLKNFIGLPTFMARRHCFRSLHFDEKLLCLEDWDLMLRIAEKHEFGFISDPLVCVNDTPGSVNKSHHHIKAKAYHRIYNKFKSDIIKNSRIHAKHLLSIGNNMILSNRCSIGRRYLKKAMRLKPYDPMIAGSLFSSFLGKRIYEKIFCLTEGITGKQP